MKTQYGDIFSIRTENDFLVVPTNVGWKRNNHNVMGAGIARRASIIYPDLPLSYGWHCKKYGNKIFVSKRNHIICLPSKPLLYPRKPHLSWTGNSNKSTISNSYRQLKYFAKNYPEEKIYTPLFGTGNGNIPFNIGMKLINSANLPDNIILILPHESAEK